MCSVGVYVLCVGWIGIDVAMDNEKDIGVHTKR